MTCARCRELSMPEPLRWGGRTRAEREARDANLFTPTPRWAFADLSETVAKPLPDAFGHAELAELVANRCPGPAVFWGHALPCSLRAGHPGRCAPNITGWQKHNRGGPQECLRSNCADFGIVQATDAR